MSHAPRSLPGDALAIVGAACRLPGGVHNLEDLWTVLLAGRDVVTEVPADRFPAADFVDSRRRPGKSYTAAGGFLADISGFDTSFFQGISPREASRMDPQHRLLLELAAETLDDAGIDAGGLRGSDTAVFIGCSSRDYGELQLCAPQTGNPYTVIGMAGAIAANRVSHFFDWHGQSVTVDTACSSALTAVHQACEHLRSGRSRAALAGGVNILLNPQGFAGFSGASMLSPTGRCRAFSANADGFVRAEGGGLVLLKRLADALAAGDSIHGVILATSTNNDGHTQGLALPSAVAQQTLLRDVYGRAGLVPDDLAYLEAHGTGTRAGDPIECEAIGRTLGTGRGTGALPIGSIKSNIGHLEAASGIAGLLKALLVLKHRKIPATLHAQPLNPDIDFTGWNLRPVVRSESLGGAGPLFAGINSFGFGGANAHVVLASPPPGPASVSEPPAPLPVMITARTPTALKAAAERMAEHLELLDTRQWYDLSWTSALRRRHHEYRAAVLAREPAEAAEGFRVIAGGTEPATGVASVKGTPGKVAFVFSGNGSQWRGMGAELLREEPVFRAAVEAVDAELRPRLGWSVLEELTAGSPRLERTEIAQPVLFAMQVGLVRLLETYGIQPDATVGHSVGEIAAAYVSGALELPAACRVLAERSGAQARTAGLGRMAAVGLSRQDIEKELASLPGWVELAGVNSDTDVTVAGEPGALAELGRRLAPRDVFFRELDLDYPFHSSAMDGIQAALEASLAQLPLRPAQRPFASTVTGGLLEGEQLDAHYWWRNVREPVLFAQAVRTLIGAGCTLFVEIGPHSILTPYLRRLVTSGAAVPTCRRDQDSAQGVHRAVAHLLAAGLRPGERLLPRPGRVVPLPAYPWQRERHWNGSPDWWIQFAQEDNTFIHPLLGRRAPAAEPAWHQEVNPPRLPWLEDHQVDGAVVMPGTGYVEVALAAGRHTFGSGAELTDLDIVQPLLMPRGDENTEVLLRTCLSQEDGILLIASRLGGTAEWRTHARGRVRRLLAPAPAPLELEAVRARLSGPRIPGELHYTRAARAGLHYGPRFQVLTELHTGEGEVLAAYSSTTPRTEHDGYQAHPTVLDGALQAASPLLANAAGGRMYLPIALGAVRVWRRPAERGLIHVRLMELHPQHAVLDITVTGEDGTVSARMTGCRLRGVDTGRDRSPQQLAPVLRAAPRPGELAVGPVPLPPPRTLLDSTAATRASLEEDQGERYATFAPDLKRTVGHWAAAAFASLLPHGGELTLEELLQAGVQPKYTPYLRLLAGMAQRAGLLQPSGTGPAEERWRFTGSPSPLEHTRACVARFPEWISAIAVYNLCGIHLTRLLRGEEDPRELLFSESDRHHIETFYTETPQAQLQSRYARCLLASALQQWPADRPLRILEVGAGTGGLTSALLPLLPPHLTRYVYTDISPVFFPRAQARFGAYDFIEYRPLDLERDLGEQGITEGSFDVVVAANVLHATSDLRGTLRRVGKALAEGGLLLAVESHDVEVLGPCFGLLEGFWAFGDRDVRTSPLLPREAWAPLLEECGFEDPAEVSSRVEEYRDDYSVLLARRQAPRTVTEPASAPVPRGRWLLVTESPEGTLETALASALKAAGATEVSLQTADTAGGWLDAMPLGAPRPEGLVLLFDDKQDGQEASIAVRRAGLLKAAAAACTASGGDAPIALWLVTGETGLFPAPDHAAAPGNAAIWGVGRVLANERPGLPLRRVSLARSGNVAQDSARLARELLQPDGEDELLLTRQGRFVPRLAGCSPRAAEATRGQSYRLDVREPGLAFQPVWTPTALPVPGPGEVIVAVRAAALNYRDAMLSTGMLPPDAEPPAPGGPAMGLECAGDVVAVGADVTDLAPGDRVFAFGHGTLASHVRVRAEYAGRMPEGMRYSEAATLPAVYLTVQHSLEALARLAPGERVLVHGGAGGIGLAALRLAEQLGAEVIATAGSPTKRDLLRMLGVRHVLDSRSLAFAEHIRGLTGGQGVDIVLNSLAGEAIARGLECLRPGGRFVELGKRDIYANQPLLLRPFRNNLAYFGVDITRLLADTPRAAAAAFKSLAQRVTQGMYRPLPHQTYPAPRVAEALENLRHSRHLGKVVVTFEDSEPVRVEQPEAPLHLDARGTYLVSGGLSGLGAATARRLASRGARSLVLLGRRGAASPEAPALLEELGRQGVRAVARATDVTDLAAVRAVFDEAHAEGRPVRGVVHAAMQLDDAPLEELNAERFATVLGAKLTGATVLDALTRERPVDFFVVYSSLAAHVGNLHQAPYAAANLFLESLVRARRAAGHPGLALAWGGIGETGYVVRHQMADTISRSGLGLMPPHTACEALERFLGRGEELAVVGLVDWQRLAKVLPALRHPRFSGQLEDSGGAPGASAAEDFQQRLARTGTEAERTALIAEVLTGLAAAVLHTTADRIDPGAKLADLGMDSLMGTQLKASMSRVLGCELPVMELMAAGSINGLTERLHRALSRR